MRPVPAGAGDIPRAVRVAAGPAERARRGAAAARPVASDRGFGTLADGLEYISAGGGFAWDGCALLFGRWPVRTGRGPR